MVDNLVKKQVIQPLRKFIEKFISHEKNPSEVTVTSSGELLQVKNSDSITSTSISEGTLAQNVRSWDYKVTFKSCPTKLSLTELLLQGDYLNAIEILKTDLTLVESVLFEACFANNSELVCILVDPDKLSTFAGDVNVKNSYGKGILHIAAAEGYFEMCQTLFQVRSDVDVNLQDHDLKTPLHLACMNKEFKIVKLMLDRQATVDMEDVFGNTPLHYAFISNSPQIIQELLSKGADTSKKNLEGKLPEDFKVTFYNGGSGVSDDCYTIKIQDENKYSIMIQEINNFFIKPYSGLGLSPHDFTPLKILGKGSFGEVYLVKKKDSGEKYAMKILAKNKVIAEELVRYALTERNIMSMMNHTFIVSLWYAFQTQSKLYLILDYCPGGTLKNILIHRGPLKEPLARNYLCEIVLALEELHRNGIIYRDLKPENVAIDSDGHIKLIDFGLAKDQVGNKESYSFCGSVSYLAPEMLRRTGHGKAVDWYLLGIVLYEMLTGRVPFFAMNNEKMFKKILKNELQLPKNASEPCQKLLKALITKFPEDRLGFVNGADDVKKHEFFYGVDWDLVVMKKVEVLKNQEFCEDGELPEDAILDKSSENLPNLQGWTFVHSEV
jgi:protein-serine/threonine kinase